jgi:hypothetical protein
MGYKSGGAGPGVSGNSTTHTSQLSALPYLTRFLFFNEKIPSDTLPLFFYGPPGDREELSTLSFFF